jgi:hypothetical protein
MVVGGSDDGHVWSFDEFGYGTSIASFNTKEEVLVESFGIHGVECRVKIFTSDVVSTAIWNTENIGTTVVIIIDKDVIVGCGWEGCEGVIELLGSNFFARVFDGTGIINVDVFSGVENLALEWVFIAVSNIIVSKLDDVVCGETVV